MKSVNFSSIDKKWQKEWEKAKVFEAKEDDKKEKYYTLAMYPYPSANGLHMGHAFQYIIPDILSRYMRMNGKSVLHPMGFDSFGLPAENAAIKEGAHPRKYTETAIKRFIIQLQTLGISYDWSRNLQSHDPNYYKWNQYFFLQFLKKGLVYRKASPVNWCEKCESVLANEQVHDGKCWRHGDTDVTVKHLEQWFVRTTRYAEELLKDVDALDWPERIKSMQRNWIGKSEGSEVLFEINGEKWPVFTTRVDTLFGVTFLVISAQHSRLSEIVTKEQKKDVDHFMKKIKSTKQEDLDKLEKEGVFTGSYAIHPLTGKKIPIWTGNFVVADYGSGVVMAVPAHDQRDFEFAKKYKIGFVHVIKPEKSQTHKERAFTDYGVLTNSESFNGLTSEEAIKHIQIWLKEKKLGGPITQYKLRDWLISRQRYWGTPIPIIYCDGCGVVPVEEKDLPVLLPDKVTFGKGNPLLTNEKFVKTKCPKCGNVARRETDTMDTFFDSSWYYLRFTDSKNDKLPLSVDNISYWMPVDFYSGGAEHACMHLIYARFFTKALRDMGYLNINEPFPRLFNQGMLHGEDGFVMSKSRGNGVDPLDMTKKYGSDTLRLFLMSVASPDKDFSWSSTGIESMYRFIQRVWNYTHNIKFGKSSPRIQHKINKSIIEIGDDIKDINYNMAVIKLRALFDNFEDEIDKADFAIALQLLSPFAPHISEELWHNILGYDTFVSNSKWPTADNSKINESIDKDEESFERTVSDVQNVLKIVKDKTKKDPSHVYLYAIPPEVKLFDKEILEKRLGIEVSVFAVNDTKKYDPQGKSSKSKPGKPGIYIE
ncbi:MAG: leucine--tRNA ligase [Nanoarchaeota archaeon]